ncbi:unnamed protein product, partial [Ranitomeya imitator]
APYDILSTKWSHSAGLGEAWDKCLKDAEPADVVACLQKVKVEKGKELGPIARRGWILLSAYRKQHEERIRMLTKVQKLEKQLCEAQNALVRAQCQNKLLMDRCDGYQHVAEKAAVHVAEYKYRKRRRKVNKNKVALAIAKAGIEWNPDQWDGDICNSTDSENITNPESEDEHFHGKREIDPPLNPVKAHPIYRRRIVETATGRWNENAVEDYSQKELNDLHDRFSQKSNESLVAWAVRLWEMGAHGVQVDAVDGPKFVQLSHEPVVKEAFRTLIIQQPHVVCSMLDVVAMALHHKYASEADWPPNEKPWFTLKDCAQRLKEEVMKNAISANTYDDYMQVVVSVSVRNRIIRNAPPAYKHVMMTLMVNQTGKTIASTLEAIRQLRDLGDWGPKQKEQNDVKSNYNPRTRITRKYMFRALIKDGVHRDKIDGIGTDAMWKLYQKRGLNRKSAVSYNEIFAVKDSESPQQGPDRTRGERGPLPFRLRQSPQHRGLRIFMLK